MALMINGSGFIPKSSVKFNGILHPSAFLNNGQLTITLNASDLTAAGNFPVVVINPAPGGGTSNETNFTVTAATQSVSLRNHYSGLFQYRNTGEVYVLDLTFDSISGSNATGSYKLTFSPPLGTIFDIGSLVVQPVPNSTLFAFYGHSLNGLDFVGAAQTTDGGHTFTGLIYNGTSFQDVLNNVNGWYAWMFLSSQ